MIISYNLSCIIYLSREIAVNKIANLIKKTGVDKKTGLVKKTDIDGKAGLVEKIGINRIIENKMSCRLRSWFKTKSHYRKLKFWNIIIIKFVKIDESYSFKVQ